VRFALLVVLLAGCDLVFRFDKNPVEETVPSRTVTLTYDRVWLGANQQLTMEPVEPDAVRVTTRDGVAIAVTHTGPGTMEFFTDAATYVIAATTEFGSAELQHKSPTLHLRERVLGRPTRTPVPPKTNIDLTVQTVPQQSGAPQMFLHSTGLWAQGSPAAPSSTFDWATASSLNGPLGMLDPDRGDDLWVLQYGPFTDNLYLRRDLWGWLRATPKLAPGGSVAVTGSMTLIQNAHCVTVTAKRADELARIATVAPSSFSEVAGDFVLSSIPHEELHAGGGVLLVGQAGTDNVQSHEIQFENPLPGKTIVSLGARRVRRYTAPGATASMELSYETRSYLPPITPAAPCMSQLLVDGAVALVDAISIGGRSIRTDDQTVEATGDLEIEWQATSEPVDYFLVALLEVEAKQLPGSNTVSTIPTTKTAITTIDRRAILWKSLLRPGHRYYVVVQAHRGVPNARDGDFATIAYPRSISSAASGVFLVE